MDGLQAYNNCLEKLIWASDRLQVAVEPTQLSQVADLIVQPMTGLWRFFHTPQHIFDVGGSEDAIEILAALFHDLVYVQVDRSVSLNLSYYITPLIQEVNGQLAIREPVEWPNDFASEIVVSIFGFVPGQVLKPFAGQNEFLSALVAAKVLEPFFLPSQLTQIIACIEATIPFRPKSKSGLTASEQLYERLRITNRRFNLRLSDEEIQEAVKKAVRLANRDIGGFADPCSANFLTNTWNLLPETNHNLINVGSYTVRDYRIAVQKMEEFMNFLVPENIFHQFQGEPDEQTYQGWVSGARKNLEIARLYLGSKMVAIALMEALSYGIGFDISLATLMGELPYQGSKGFRLEKFIPDVTKAHEPKTDLELEVLNLLEKGRAENSDSDLKESPLATFIIKSIGFEEMQHQSKQAKEFFKGNISAVDFISGFNRTVTAIVVEALVQLFDSRKSSIRRYYYGIISGSKPKPPTNSQELLDRATDPPALDIIKPSCHQD
jgi:hypothetical protein